MTTMNRDIEAAAAEYDYDHFGLRITDDLPEDGEILPPSRRWDDGVPTDETLPGTSCLSLDRGATRALRLAAAYVGAYVILVGGNRAESGEDEGEAVIRDAQVLAAWAMDGRRLY